MTTTVYSNGLLNSIPADQFPFLTTERAASSHGLPVLHIPADGIDLGPSDQMPAEFGDYDAAEWVHIILAKGGAGSYLLPDATGVQGLVRRFLQSSPNSDRYFWSFFGDLA